MIQFLIYHLIFQRLRIEHFVIYYCSLQHKMKTYTLSIARWRSWRRRLYRRSAHYAKWSIWSPLFNGMSVFTLGLSIDQPRTTVVMNAVSGASVEKKSGQTCSQIRACLITTVYSCHCECLWFGRWLGLCEFSLTLLCEVIDTINFLFLSSP